MLVLLVLLLGAAAVCARLGVWQLDRAQLRGEQEEQERRAAAEAAPPEPLADVLAPQTTFDGALVGVRVDVAGTYRPEDQLLVVDRALDGATGFLVLTPLDVEGSGGVLPVVRGWVATADDAAGLTTPAGTVRLTGYLQASEGSGDGGLEPGRTDAISSAQLVNVWGGPIYTGYLVVATSDPADDPALATLPPPTAQGSGLNLQNLAYAAQWWIFGGFALFLWVRMVRDEAAGYPGADAGPSAEA